MDAGAGDLARGPQARERSGAVEVHEHAARQVVRRRSHRQPVPAGVETDLGQRDRDRREPPPEVLELRRVEPDVLAALLRQLDGDRPAHEVPRQQLVDETVAGSVAQHRAVAAKRLGDERARHGRVMERRRVELHELDVGDRDSGAKRHGDPVAGRLGRVRRDRSTAGPRPPQARTTWVASTCCSSPDGSSATSPVHRPASTTRSRANHSSRIAAALSRTAATRARSTSAPVAVPAGVQDACRRVPAFPGSGQPAAGDPVEDGAESDQLVDPDSEPSSTSTRTAAWSHKPGPGAERVGQVQVGRVLVAGQHRGDAALGPARRRLLELALGEDADAGPAELGQAHRRRQARHPAADHEDVEAPERGSPPLAPGAGRGAPAARAHALRRPGCRSGGPARPRPR